MKYILSVSDLTNKEVNEIFKLAKKFEKNPYSNCLKNKNFVLLFEKPSTRTRLSFEVGINHLGGNVIYLDPLTTQLSRGETLEDTARILEKYVDCIIARVYKHETLEILSENAKVPMVNALSDIEHPCQALTDLYTIKQRKKKLKKLKITFLGDGTNNTFNSLIYLCERFGLEVVVSSPKEFRPKIKGKYRVIEDPTIAVRNSDILYIDTFVSMGEKNHHRIEDLKKYQLNSRLLKLAKKNAIVMHPLMAHREVEITSDVMDGKQSVIFEQAENRLHVQKAILYLLMK